MAEPRRNAANDTGDLAGVRMLVVEARFYDDIADALLAGATRALEAAGVAFERVSVPGSLEVPSAIAIALEAAEQAGRPYDGVLALGCVIRGRHHRPRGLRLDRSARALMDLVGGHAACRSANGILTVDTEAQAWARARPEEADKGGDAARAALVLWCGSSRRLGPR